MSKYNKIKSTKNTRAIKSLDGEVDMFDLDDIGNSKNVTKLAKYVKPARVLTDDEKREKLEGYIIIPRKFWRLLRYRTHIRYITKAGEFRMGGFVIDNSSKIDDRDVIRLENGYTHSSAGYYTWMFACDDIENIYAKPDAIMATIIDSINDIKKQLTPGK